MRTYRLASIFASITLALLTHRACADFSGPYAVPQGGIFLPNNLPAVTAVGSWTLLNSTTYAYPNAYLLTYSTALYFNTGISIRHYGGDFQDLQLTTTIAASGMVSFDYSISLFTTGPFSAVNYAGYTLNGALVKLPAGTGSVNLPVNSGDVFGFDAYAGPNCIVCQPAFAGGTMMTVTNFNAPVPEASTVTFFVSGAVGLALLRVRAKRKD